MRHDKDRILDILDAIKAIQNRAHSKKVFDDDDMVRVWCLHHITVIGEAASRISDELCAKHATVPWRRIVAMRNAIVHGYFQVDWDQVWIVIDKELQTLRSSIEDLIQKENWTD